jgi:hypothetical protein
VYIPFGFDPSMEGGLLHLRHARFLAAAAVLLLPATAHADRHATECFGAYTNEKESSSLLRMSCGRLIDYSVLTKFQNFFTALAPGSQDKTHPPSPPIHTYPTHPRRKGSFFLYIEGDEYVSGKEGHGFDGGLLGGRYFFRGGKTVQPFVGGLSGWLRPASHDVDGGPLLFTGIANAGIDLVPPFEWTFLPVLRFEGDIVKIVDHAAYARGTASLTIRIEY